MSEKEFQAQIIELCKLLQLRYYHTHDSRRSVGGFPDLVIVGTSVLFIELKTDRGIATPEQREWIDHLNRAGATAGVWRPKDWVVINDTLHELAGRKMPSRRWK